MKFMKSWVLCWWLLGDSSHDVLGVLGSVSTRRSWSCLRLLVALWTPLTAALSRGRGWNQGPPCRPAPAAGQRMEPGPALQTSACPAGAQHLLGLQPWRAFRGFMRSSCAQFRHLGQALESVTSLQNPEGRRRGVFGKHGVSCSWIFSQPQETSNNYISHQVSRW